MKKTKKIILSMLILTFTGFAVYANENESTKVIEKDPEKKDSGKGITNYKRKFYYVGENYTIYWHEIDDEWYYFREDGRMVVGWQEIPIKHIVRKFNGDNVKELAVQSKWNYFDENGVLTDDGGKFLPKKDININKKFGYPIREIGVESKVLLGK